VNHVDILRQTVDLLEGSVELSDDFKVKIIDQAKLRKNIEIVVRQAVLDSPLKRGMAQWLLRACALASGVIPASIHEFYISRGKGETRDNFTVPAMNLRSLTFFAARAVFRSAAKINAKAMIFEIARSEIGYTDQRPAEYAANIVGAAIAEGFEGPVFLQGDHFQISAKRYKQDADAEVNNVLSLSKEAIAAGFYNIDIDTSTLVDLDFDTIDKQQTLNYSLCSQIASYVRSQQPEEIEISLGGEIGEVGGHNSTEPELRAFMDGFDKEFGESNPGDAGLSKISIQTGTSHGGVVLPDGSIASVNVDFDTLEHLSRVAKEYGMGGAVQHGASTLPESAFSKFADAGALEVHLATNFQNILYNHLPQDLVDDIHAYLDKNHADERKPDQTDDQFYYKTRKRALGPYKEKIWSLPRKNIDRIGAAWEEQFSFLFDQLNIANTAELVDDLTPVVPILPDPREYAGEETEGEDVGDLAD
jgi:fructose/tagatose bisphosphate aldolase